MRGNQKINAGKWRFHQEPMQVISGTIGKEKVHFEAPPSDRVPLEMKKFTDWYNRTTPGNSEAILHAPVRSAIAHLYFESIHPFEDGNGRIGRAISEKTLSQGAGRPILLSLSQAIESRKKDYYSALQKAQSSNEITGWIHYFVNTILEAQKQTEDQIHFILKKTRFFDTYKDLLNERQEKVLQKMFDKGPEGFEGGMSAKKYMSIAKTSKATATRDLQDLFQKGALQRSGGGRNVHYQIPE